MATTASLSGYSAFFSSGLLAPPRTDLAPASPSAFLKSEPSTPRSESDVDMDRETTPTPALRASTSSNSSSGTAPRVRRRRSSLSLSVSAAPAQIKAPVAPQRTRAGSVAADKTGATRAGRARSGSMGIVLRPRRSMRPVSLALNHAKPPPSVPLPPLPSPGCKLALSTIEASPRTAPPTQERFNLPPSSPVDPFLAERRPLAQYSENRDVFGSQPLKA